MNVGSGYEVAALWRYPVKSMLGERVEAADLDVDGVVGDRRWGVRRLTTGRLASAKKTRPFGGLLHWTASMVDDNVEVRSPDGEVWLAGDPALDEALSAAFGESVAMAAMEADREESYDIEWEQIPGALPGVTMKAPVAGYTASSSFVDASAVHLVTTGSIDHLSSLIGAQVPVERFRPTALLRSLDDEGSAGFSDLDWGEVSATLGGVGLRMGGPTPRCVMTTLSQSGLEQDRGPLQALSANARRDTAIGRMPCLGTMAEVQSSGNVRIGDRFALGD